MVEPLILVTNDDGIYAPGLEQLASALEPLGEVWVYAPDRQQSGVGHSVSLHRPLRVSEIRERWFSVDGTPTDCVMLAVRDLLARRPDVVVSGINNGANLGDDVTYSGTVAGAYEGMLLDLAAIAVSDVSYSPAHLDTAGRVANQLTAHVLANGLPHDTMLNVNVPDVPFGELQGVAVTRMGRRNYADDIIRRTDPRGGDYYWIGGAEPDGHVEIGTDFDAVERKLVSVTPLQRDVTNYRALDELAQTPFALVEKS